ncbi:MAG TPA: GNAT family N-acetyltransferase [Candidatus Elarobacter sp.]|jgi:ribosomal protein S18 acetylase RimI-like enzyme|nr:GNAT family N-acetyltransferase [Candidatus Elarobacter sp.]
MTGVHVRRATETDIPLLAEHRTALRVFEHGIPPYQREFALAVTAQTYAELFAAGDLLGWIVERHGATAGSVCAWLRRMLPHVDGVRPLEARIQAMYILPEYRRSRCGTALMEVMLEELRARDVRRAYLHPSEAGRHFYPAFGFRDADEMELFFPSDGNQL